MTSRLTKKSFSNFFLNLLAVFWWVSLSIILLPFTAYSQMNKKEWLYVGPSDISAGDFYVLNGSIKKKDDDIRLAVILNIMPVKQIGIYRHDASGKGFLDKSKPYRSILHSDAYDCKNKRIGSVQTQYFSSEFPSNQSLVEVDVDQDPRWFNLIIEKKLFTYICSK
jgi:hypothetical protein